MFGQKAAAANARPVETLITEPTLVRDLDYKPGIASSITLIKVRDLHGAQPVGATFAWTYKWTREPERLARARKAFEAATKLDPDYKDEKLSDWELMK